MSAQTLRVRDRLVIVLLAAGCGLSISSVRGVGAAEGRAGGRSAREDSRPRIVATTDGEIDDRCSMIRFLLYCNEWDVEGIVYSSSKFHWDGHKWSGVHWIEEDVDKYAQVYGSLKQHDPGFPSPRELKEKIFVGNIDNVGSMDKDTPGSDRIVDVLLDSKPGPVYLQAWGGTNTIARALWKIQHEHPDKMEMVSKKAIIYIILDQDDTFRQYILPNWPNLQVLGSFHQFGAIAYRWAKIIPEGPRAFYETGWMTRHILRGHGPLCSAYPSANFKSEGDTPSFLHQIRVGLRSLEDPSYGGWGGRFQRDEAGPKLWRGAEDDGDVFKPIWRWSEALQNDFAARADWCVKSYEDANHPPAAKVAGALDRTIRPGQRAVLSAEGSSDPDGDRLSFKWWRYADADTADGETVISHADAKAGASLVAPNQPGRTIHIILEVTDDGSPKLTRCQRVVFRIAQ